jgi:hypothetical protein
MQAKPLSLIHMESATPFLAKIAEEGVATRIVAIYLCTPSELRRLRTEGEDVLAPKLEEAEDLPSTEVSEVLADFFGQHERYQNSILKSAGMPDEMMLRLKMEVMERSMKSLGLGISLLPPT